MDRFVAKLRSRQALSAGDEAMLLAAAWRVERHRRHDVIRAAGTAVGAVHLLQSGFAARVHRDADGGGQIVGLAVPGDLLDIHAMVLGELVEDVVALSPCKVAALPHRDALSLIRRSAAVRNIFWLQAAIEHSIQSAWTHALGAKRGTAKVAHLFCEMQLRLALVGIAGEPGFPLPLSQQELADYAGMTHVHLNRCLRELREAGMVSFAHGLVNVHDFAALQRLARFDDRYLNLRQIEV